MPRRDGLDPSIRAYVTSPRIASDYDRYFQNHPLLACDLDFVLEHVVPGARVLDCGAGTGRHALPLARRGCPVTAVDLSEPMIAELRRKVGPDHPFVRIVRADLRALPFGPAARFDAALLLFSTLGMIHPASARLALLRRLRELLDDRGIVLLHVHNNNYRYSPHRLGIRPIKTRLLRIAGRLEPGDHIVEGYRGEVDLRLHSFTLAEVRDLMRAAGLELIHEEGLNDDRDGPCPSPNIDEHANGFFFVAQRID